MSSEPANREVQDVPTKIVAALDRIGRGVRSFHQTVAVRLGLSPLQLELLLLLAAGEPPQPITGALARELGVRGPTVTDSLNALERKGLVVRSSDVRDGRRTPFRLTDAGERLAREADEADQVMRDAIGRIPSEDALLEGLLSAIDALLGAGVVDVARTCTSCRFFRTAADGAACALLQIPLPRSALRVDCPEHEPVAGYSGTARN